MIQRKEIIEKYFSPTGESQDYKFLSGLIPEDHLIVGMYKYLYILVNNENPPSAPSSEERKIKLYLTRNYVSYK